MSITERVQAHGGIAAVHVTPVTDAAHKVIGWRNIVVCHDGHREYPTLAEQDVLANGGPVPKGFRA